MQLKLSEMLEVLRCSEIYNLFEDPDRIYVNSFVVDSRESKDGSVFFALKGRRVDGHNFVKDAYSKGAKVAVVERKIAEVGIVQLVVNSTIEALNNLAINVIRKKSTKIIGITGSNGKTTTKELIHHLLKKTLDRPVFKNPGNLNTEIGLPVSILNYYNFEDILVLEFGISKRGDMDRIIKNFKPDIGVFLNCGSAHLGNFKDEDEIFSEKSKMIKSIDNGAVVLYADDERFLKLSEDLKNLSIKFFGQKSGDVKLLSWKYTDDLSSTIAVIDVFGKLYSVILNGIWNRGQLLDLCAAICTIKILELNFNPDDLEDFKLLRNRFNVQKVDKIVLVDDTYNSSIESVKEALNTIKLLTASRKIAVIGSILEQGSKSIETHEKLGELINASDIDHVIVYSVFSDVKYSISTMKEKVVFESSVLDEVADKLIKFLRPGDLIYFKASRAVEMERVIERVWKSFSEQ